jgi:hypothetical protein
VALPKVETFTNANVANLTTYNASWVGGTGSGTMGINSNACYPGTSAEHMYRWTGDAFTGNHYSEGTIVAIDSTGYVGTAVRCQSGAQSYYGFYGNSTESFLFKMVTGSWTQIGSTLAGFSVSAVIRCEISGTALVGKRDGSTVSSGTDSALSNGSAGLCGFASSTGSRIDDVTLDNVSAATGKAPPPRRAAQRVVYRARRF